MAQHIHKYRRVNIGRDKEYWVMQCGLSNCSHYVPMDTKLSIPSLIGKVAICNRCNNPFELDRQALRKAKPVCASCIVSPNQKRIDRAVKFLEDFEKKVVNGED